MIRLNEATLERSEFLELWKEEMTLNMRRMNPDWDEDDIEKVLDKMLLEQMMIPDVELDNNYTAEHKEASALSVLDWVLKREPQLH